MQVELVTHNPRGGISGIGRYTLELHQALQPHIDVRIVREIMPPLVNRFSILQHFPLGIEGHRPSAIVHFMQIMGCSQMLWRPTRPAIATVHDLGVLVCREDEVLFDWIGRRSLDVQFQGLRHMDHYIVHSERTRDGLVEHLQIDPHKITIVSSSVDLEKFYPIAQAEARTHLAQKYKLVFEPNTTYLINVGSELPRKNLQQLLAVMRVLKDRGFSVALLKIGGAGGERWRQEFMHQIAQAGLVENVHLVGTVDEIDLTRLYSASDIAVTTTLLEGGFAWVAMEGMACGRPVVASPSALIPKSAERGALVVDPASPEKFAAAIERLITSPDLQKTLSLAGREIIVDYTWARESQQTIAVYERVLQAYHP